jgi:D-aspartate ligase
MHSAAGCSVESGAAHDIRPTAPSKSFSASADASPLAPLQQFRTIGKCTMDHGIPAVIILGGLNGLGVSRSLGRGYVATYVVDTHRFSPGMWSRYAQPVLSRGLQGEVLVTTLLELQSRLGICPVLFNTHELAVLALSQHRNSLAGRFRFRLPPHETVVALQDKARFHELATSAGLPVPRGSALRSDSDIGRVLRALRLPVVVKPADKATVHEGRVRGVRVCHDRNEAIAVCERTLKNAGETVVQEWVEGRNDQIYFCLFYRGRGGKIVSIFTGRKLASTPPDIGLTAFCVAASEAREALEPITESFLESVDYAGMGSIEYKWDRSNRRFVIIEPTVGRTDWQEEIATLSGVNIPLDAYRHELDLPPSPSQPCSASVVWRASIWERLKSTRPAVPPNAVVYDGYWRRDDPMPAIIQYSYCTVAGAFRRLRRRIRGAERVM